MRINSMGFSGSSMKNMSDKQIRLVRTYLLVFMPTTVGHGDCVMCDEDFHNLVRHTLPKIQIHGHPGAFVDRKTGQLIEEHDKRANCQVDVLHPIQGHFARNRTIVDTYDILIACPLYRNATSGGTIYTINYAIKKKKPLVIVTREGQFEEFNL